LVALADTPDFICVSDYYGQVVLRNDGYNTLTTATLNVKVNGALEQYPWTGALNYLERDTMTFGGFHDFSLSDEENQVQIWFSDVNGSTAVSNRINSSFSNSPQAHHGVQLRLYTDNKPYETTWKLYNSAGDVVQEGGPYADPMKLYIENFPLTQDDCYLLEFLDAGNDGIKGNNGTGYYQLFQIDHAGMTQHLTQGNYDGAVHEVYFNLTEASSTGVVEIPTDEVSSGSCHDLQGRRVLHQERGVNILDGKKVVVR
jgi:hypothetical protein